MHASTWEVGLPHMPPAHVVPPVHPLPSSHVMPSLAGWPPRHFPAEHVSPAVHELPSLHAPPSLPLVMTQVFWFSLQTPILHTSMGGTQGFGSPMQLALKQ